MTKRLALVQPARSVVLRVVHGGGDLSVHHGSDVRRYGAKLRRSWRRGSGDYAVSPVLRAFFSRQDSALYTLLSV